MGNTTEKQLENILDNFRPLSIAPFSVGLQDLIYWPKPAIIGASIQDEGGQLLQCKKQIEKQLSQLDFFSFDKKTFKPHITLFRNVVTPLKHNQFFNKKIQIEHISLIHSQNSRHGVHYHTLEQWQLANPSIKEQLLGR